MFKSLAAELRGGIEVSCSSTRIWSGGTVCERCSAVERPKAPAPMMIMGGDMFRLTVSAMEMNWLRGVSRAGLTYILDIDRRAQARQLVHTVYFSWLL